MSNFWKSILSSNNTTSSKRLITLIISFHFIIASFSILFIAFYVIFYLPKGKVEPQLLTLLKEVLEYDFYIILSGLGFITVDNMGQILLQKAKALSGIPDRDDDRWDRGDRHKKEVPTPPDPPKEEEMVGG